MTVDRRAALVEKVGKLLWYDGSGFDIPNHLLTAAIDIALEEAAKVVEAMPRTYDKVKEDADVLGMKGTWTLTLYNGPVECAAAIRDLKEKTNDS